MAKSKSYNSRSSSSTKLSNVVNEAATSYVTSPSNLRPSPKDAAQGKVVFLKGGLLSAVSGNLTNAQKMAITESGISKKDLEGFKAKTGLDYDSLAKLLAVARATLINKKGSEKFSESLSERIMALADIYVYGYEVFADETKFNEWIFAPNQGLGGISPFEMLHNSYGRDEVKCVIGRLEYGVYS